MNLITPNMPGTVPAPTGGLFPDWITDLLNGLSGGGNGGVNVSRYGKDDAAFTAGLAEAARLGTFLYVPPGNYTITEVSIPSGVWVVGTAQTYVNGGRFKSQGTSQVAVVGMSGTFGIFFNQVQDYYVADNRINATNEQFYFNQCNDGYVLRNRITNVAYNDQPIMYWTQGENCRVEGNYIKNANLFNDNPNSWNTGINPSSARSFTIIHNHVENCGGQGITIDTLNSLATHEERETYRHLVAHNVCIGNGQEGITCYAGKQQYETHHITISNNICLNNHFDGIECWGVQWVTIANNQISAPDPRVSYSFGAINVFSSSDMVITGNQIDNVPNSGIALQGFTSDVYPEYEPRRITITNNLIKDWNNQDLDYTEGNNHDYICAVNLTHSDMTIVQGNTFLNTITTRLHEIKAISLVSGRHYVKGNLNPSQLPYSDHPEADNTWGPDDLAERNPPFVIPDGNFDPWNPEMENPPEGAMWYDPDHFLLKYFNRWGAPVIAAVVIDPDNMGYPIPGYMEGGYLIFQQKAKRLCYRIDNNNSNGLYMELMFKNKYVSMLPVDDLYLTKTPEPGDMWFDETANSMKYCDNAGVIKTITGV